MEQSTPKQSPYLIPGAIIVAGLIIAGAVVLGQNFKLAPKSQKTPSVDSSTEVSQPAPPRTSKTEIEVTEKDHIRGNPEAPVTIVEYSDFQCPFCQRFHPTLQQVLADYPDKVRWVYRHFPIDQIHPQARPAAEASECVAEQKGNDGFWQFADALFENQSRLGESLFKELAQNLGLDMAQFDACFSSRKYQERVETDLQEGISLGVRGTPGSFVNGELVEGAVSLASLKVVIESVLGNQ